MNNKKNFKTLGIITIATGKYFEEFIPNLKATVDEHFQFRDYEVRFYCFTDSLVSIDGVINVPIRHLSWPFSTLLRYHWIRKNLEELKQYDYLIYMDADMRVVSTPPISLFKSSLIAVRHPGYLSSPGAFEIDRQDSCYIPPPLRKNYYQGCFWGGQTDAFCTMIDILAQMVEDDLSKGQIPIWHDESYLNKYLSDKDCEPLPPTYAWPEDAILTQTPYVLHLEKKHKIIRQTLENNLNIKNLILGCDCESELEIYKRLYLNSHEKCQRLESRLSIKHIWWSKLKEYFSFYKEVR
jgi:histo-blood group ABO system transferase